MSYTNNILDCFGDGSCLDYFDGNSYDSSRGFHLNIHDETIEDYDDDGYIGKAIFKADTADKRYTSENFRFVNDSGQGALSFAFKKANHSTNSNDISLFGVDNNISLNIKIINNNINLYLVDYTKKYIKDDDGNIIGEEDVIVNNDDDGWGDWGTEYVNRIIIIDTYILSEVFYHLTVNFYSDKFDVFIDGTLSGSSIWGYKDSERDWGDFLGVGYDFYENYSIVGSLDEIRFFTRSLTSDEAKQLGSPTAIENEPIYYKTQYKTDTNHLKYIVKYNIETASLDTYKIKYEVKNQPNQNHFVFTNE